ncbi:MAG: hypothetical protein WCP93_03175 [Candidatus Berkelbacteria bacterium]
MRENLEQNLNLNEVGETGEKQTNRFAWLIDDNADMSEALVRLVGRCSNGQLELTHFFEAEHAINEFEKICSEDLNRPELILMDGNLTGNVPQAKIKTGVEAIDGLKDVAQKYNVDLPDIVAFSTSSQSNEDLLARGAVKVVNKGNYNDIKNFVTELAEAECE